MKERCLCSYSGNLKKGYFEKIFQYNVTKNFWQQLELPKAAD